MILWISAIAQKGGGENASKLDSICQLLNHIEISSVAASQGRINKAFCVWPLTPSVLLHREVK